MQKVTNQKEINNMNEFFMGDNKFYQGKKFEEDFEFLKVSNNKLFYNSSKSQTPNYQQNILDLKSSKAYINAMKALQDKIKKLELILEENTKEFSEKMLQKVIQIEKFEELNINNMKSFNEVEINLKNKLVSLEKENFNHIQLIKNLEEDVCKLEEILNITKNKNNEDFQNFLNEKNNFRNIINEKNDKINILEVNIENFEFENEELKKLKKQYNEEISKLKEINKEYEEKIQIQTSSYEAEK